MDEQLRTTALTARHEAAGAKMAPFAGWRMPLEFAGTLAEHRAVREEVGVFDVSHLGTVWVTGSGALAAVSGTLTNDPGSLENGTSQYTLCCDDDGGIVDDLIVYRIAENRLLAVPNAANTAAVVARLSRAAESAGAAIHDTSTEYAIIAVQGPRALDVVGQVLGTDPAAVPYLGIEEVERGRQSLWLCRTGYTGEVGCELVVPDEDAGEIWDGLLDAGAEPCGLGARDTLRLEMGYPLHGNDLDGHVDPYTAGLGWAVKLDHGPFTGQEALRAIRERGPAQRLRGLRGEGRRPPRPGMAVHHDGNEVGRVTSGSFSPTLGIGIGLAYIDAEIGLDKPVSVDVRGTDVPFTVVRPPFVERTPRGDG